MYVITGPTQNYQIPTTEDMFYKFSSTSKFYSKQRTSLRSPCNKRGEITFCGQYSSVVCIFSATLISIIYEINQNNNKEERRSVSQKDLQINEKEKNAKKFVKKGHILSIGCLLVKQLLKTALQNERKPHHIVLQFYLCQDISPSLLIFIMLNAKLTSNIRNC